MDKYEITYLVANEEIAAKTLAAKAVEKAGGAIIQVRDMGQRNLAYKIKGLNSAYYGNLVVDLEPKMVAIIDRALRLDNNILRHLIVKGVYEQKPVQTEDDDKKAEARKADAAKAEKVEVAKPEETLAESTEPVVGKDQETGSKVTEEVTEKPKTKKVKKEEVAVEPEKVKSEKTIEIPKPTEEKPKPTAKKTPKDAISEDDRLAQLENKLEKLLNE